MEGMDLKLFFNNIILNKIYNYYNSAEIFAEKWKNITEYNYNLLSVFFEIEVKNMKFGDYSEN